MEQLSEFSLVGVGSYCTVILFFLSFTSRINGVKNIVEIGPVFKKMDELKGNVDPTQ